MTKEQPKTVELTEGSFAPWSYSKWKTFANCPLQGYLKYILKIKGVYVEAPETVIGKAAHAVLENVISGMDVESAKTKAKPEFQAKLDWQKEIEEGLTTQFLNFQSRFNGFKRMNPVYKTYQEVRIAVTKDWTPTTFFAPDCFYRGVMDLGLHLQNNDLVVLDHKTGAPAAMGLTPFQKQLDVYKILFHYAVAPISGASSGIHYVRDSEIKIGKYSPAAEITGSLKNGLEFDLKAVVSAIEMDGRFKKIKGHYCKYCDYAVDCKAKKLDHYTEHPVKIIRNV